MSNVLGNASKGLLFVLSAPAGTGKTTISEKLQKEFPGQVVQNVSCTTRSPRDHEVNGKHYHFFDKPQFRKLIDEDAFLEYAEVYGHYYGTLRKTVEETIKEGKHVLLVIDTQGALHVQKKIDSTLIFLKPPSIEELFERLRSRSTESTQEIETRIKQAEYELKQSVHYDYIVVNDELEIAYDVVRSIIIAEEHRRKQQ